MRRFVKAITSITLAALVLMMNASAAFAAAAEKNETVYVKISPKGRPLSCDVVTWLDTQGKNEIQDITSLNEVKVIPDTIKVHLTNKTGRDASIVYDNFRSDRQESFSKKEYTPFMAQVEIDLPLDTFYDIDAPESSSIVLGKTMKLIWLKFPYPEEDVSVKMKTDCFALDPVSITLMPQMPPVSGVELEQNLKDMYSGVIQMDDKLQLLIDGIEKAHAGSGSLKAGIAQFSAAFDSAADGGKKLAQGLPTLSAGLNQASGAAGQLGLATDAQLQMIDNIMLANSELQKSIGQLQKMPGMEKAAAQLLAGLQKQQALIGLLKEGGKLPDGKDFPGLSTVKAGIVQLKGGIDKCHAGAEQSAAGATALAAGLEKLDGALPAMGKGAADLDNGLLTIQNGIKDFRTLGIVKLEDGVADQINEVRKGMSEKDTVQKLADEYVSFTGDKSNGGRVEFLLQSDSIKAPVSNTVASKQSDTEETQTDSDNKNLFVKIGDFLKKLFGMK